MYIINVKFPSQEEDYGSWYWDGGEVDEIWGRENSLGNLDRKSPSEKNSWYASSEENKVYGKEKAQGTNSKNYSKLNETAMKAVTNTKSFILTLYQEIFFSVSRDKRTSINRL